MGNTVDFSGRFAEKQWGESDHVSILVSEV